MTEAGGLEPDEAEWRRLAERAIGAGIETLTSRSADELPISPLYPRLRVEPGQPWRAATAWSLAQRVDHPDAEAANKLALLDLEGGADALVLVGAQSPHARGFGLDLAEDLEVALADVELDFISLRLEAGPATPATFATFARLVEARRLTSAGLDVDIGFDPIGWRARLGRPVEADPAPLIALRASAGLAGSLFLADGRPYHEAGASEGQELAAVLATALAYLRRQEALGVPLDEAGRAIALLLPADADVLLGLAKFRAMRRLWARVEQACGLAPAPLRLHAETSWRMMTRYDPWTNVMRATAAAFAAGLGGVDRIAVLPFTLALGLPDAAARRLARNTQRVLLDEAQLGRVADPAAGAGGFEALTEALCVKAWDLFQEIEREGGIEAALPALAGRIAATARARADRIAHLAQGIVGTSRFPSLDTPPVAVLDVAARREAEAPPGDLPALRDAASFEALRARADALAAENRRPAVVLASLGAPAAFGPRAAEAINFFAAAGIVAEAGPEAGGAIVACLCGSDADYATQGHELIAALRAAGAQRVLLVGRANLPVDACIHEGCAALDILTDTLAACVSAA